MQLRRFTADTTPAALGAVRLALGDDAIILANRKIGDQVEIIATGQMEDAQAMAEISLDDSQFTSTNGRSASQDSGRKLQSRDAQANATPQTPTAAATTIEALAAVVEEAEKHAESTPIVQSGQSPLSMYLDPVSPAASSVLDDVRSSDYSNKQSKDERAANRAVDMSHGLTDSTDKQTLVMGLPKNEGSLGTDYKSAYQELQSEDVDSSTAQQIAQIIEAQSAMIDQYFKGLEVNLWGNSAPNRTAHLQQLFTLGIGAELAIKLVERSNPEHSVDDALRQSFALLKSTLPIGVDKTFSIPGVTIISGSPGAGKTTVLMKIATQHVKVHGNDSIVIICADTRRIGAFEELQAYGRLLGVPTVHAHDSAELDSLLRAFTHKQLVLIDHTLPMDADAVELPVSLQRPETPDSVRQLLVLSATDQAATIDALIARHCMDRSMQCVLTHLDASARLGEMFNAIIRHHLPIAYWSDSASVQNPLQKAEASVLIATAVAMSKRLRQSPDDEWLLRLVQPSDRLIAQPVQKKPVIEVSA